MAETGINAVIHGKFDSVSFHDVGSGYTYFPAYDTVIENVSVEDLGENDGCVIRGEQLQIEMNHNLHSEDREFYDTYKEAIQVWRPRSITIVENGKRRFVVKPKFPFVSSYREVKIAGYRPKQGWVTRQETLPVQIQIPINVPLVSYTHKVIPVSPKRGLLEE